MLQGDFIEQEREECGHCTDDISQDVCKVNPSQQRDVFSLHCFFIIIWIDVGIQREGFMLVTASRH